MFEKKMSLSRAYSKQGLKISEILILSLFFYKKKKLYRIMWNLKFKS